MGLIWSLVIGACAGFLGSKIFKGASSGLLWNLIIGILGGFLGGFVFDLVGLGGDGLIWQLISATVGSILLLWIVSKVRK